MSWGGGEGGGLETISCHTCNAPTRIQPLTFLLGPSFSPSWILVTKTFASFTLLALRPSLNFSGSPSSLFYHPWLPSNGSAELQAVYMTSLRDMVIL